MKFTPSTLALLILSAIGTGCHSSGNGGSQVSDLGATDAAIIDGGSEAGPACQRDSQCSMGKALAPDASLPFEPMSLTLGKDVPFCVAHCGANAPITQTGTGTYDMTGIPTGACGCDGERCGFGALPPCICGDGLLHEMSPNQFLCTCTHGSWSCVMIAGSDSLPCSCGGS